MTPTLRHSPRRRGALGLLALVAVAAGCVASDEEFGSGPATSVAEAFEPVAPSVPGDWEGPSDTSLEAAAEVVARLEDDLDEERILAGCPFRGVIDGFNIAGLAEPEGSLLCYAGDSETEVTTEGTIVIGGSVPYEFDLLLGPDHVDSDEVALGAGTMQTACAEAEVCVARWQTDDFQVVVIDFVVSDPDEAPTLLAEVIVPVVEGTADFDVAGVGI